MSETARAGGVCRLSLSGRWLVTGPNGGYHDCEAAHVVSVPEGFQRTDLGTYTDERLAAAGFAGDGPALLTGVDAARARCARSGSVTVLATAGLSNPARLPVEPSGTGRSPDAGPEPGPGPTGTVNLLVATTRALSDGTLATLLGTAVEAKTATLQATTGFSGTTSDAVAVGSDTAGDPAAFAGSATDLGAATRVCVRDALRAGLDAGADPPATVADAEHGVVTGGTADVFQP